MKNGRLILQLPEGGAYEFGSGESGPEAVIQLHNNQFYHRGVLYGKMGFGEGYQAGDWDSPNLADVIGWFCCNMDTSPTRANSFVARWGINWFERANRFRHRLNQNSIRGSRRNIQAHYDLGNSFYQLWLDPTMSYSSALFEYPDQTLEAAQSAKYERLCQRLRIGTQDHVLEIGCGWGGFLSHAIRTRGCRVTAITISEEQLRFTRERLVREGIADRATVELRDYRTLESLNTRFDQVVSIEMLEAVGDEYLEKCLSIVQSVLKPNGLFGAQFIVCPDSRHTQLRHRVDWIQKHIFPGSLLLSLNRIGNAMQQGGDLWLCNLEDLGGSYATTLRDWRRRFTENLGGVRSLGFDDYFIRTWTYYLAYCEAAFAWHNISVVQAVWTRPNNRRLISTSIPFPLPR